MKLQDASPQIGALVRDTKRLRTDDAGGAASIRDSALPTRSDPPLLLVRVYQDTVANLVKTNAELAGLNDTLLAQQTQLKKVDQELTRIAQNRVKFEKLKRDVDIAKSNSEAAARRAIDQEIDHALASRQFARVQIVQEPTVPANPTFPTRTIVLLFSCAAGVGMTALYLLARVFMASEEAERFPLMNEGDASAQKFGR